MNDLDTLARTLYGEAEVGDVDDAKAIAAVVLNRVRYPNWPNKISAVCLQAWQFSCWNANNPRRQHLLDVDLNSSPWLRECHDIAKMAIDGKLTDITKGSTHYWATYIKEPKWAKGKVPVFETPAGRYNHLFYNDIDTKPPQTAAEALDQVRPVAATRTAVGAQVSGASVTLAGAADIVTQTQDQISPLVHYGEIFKWAFLALALAGIAVTVYARFSDRQDGIR
jgi:hypothetical protein